MAIFSAKPPDPAHRVPNSGTRFRKIGLGLFALAGALSAAVSSVNLTVPNQISAPGSSLILPLKIETASGNVSGVQFDLEYDNSAVSLEGTIGDAARTSSKLLYEVDVTPSKRRFLIVGLNVNQIPNGTVLNLFVNVLQSAKTGQMTLALSNAAATDPYGVYVPVVTSSGIVTIQGASDQSTPLQLAGVLNGASLVAGAIAPGEIFTLLGSNIGPAAAPPATQQTTVTIGGYPAVILYASLNQINGIVPFEIAGALSSEIRITSGDREVSRLTVPVSAASPAIFTVTGSGVGQGATLNLDGSVNSPSNPTSAGSVVTFFATGAGLMTPSSTDGAITGTTLATPVSQVSVRVDGMEAEVLYAGSAPGMVAGVLQVNCRVPAGAGSGYAVPVILTVGGADSPSVTLAVR